MNSKIILNDGVDFEYFSLKYGTEVNELLSYYKETEYKNGINIFRRDMSGDILEEFIFANVKVNNKFKYDYDKNSKGNHRYDTEDMIIRK